MLANCRATAASVDVLASFFPQGTVNTGYTPILGSTAVDEDYAQLMSRAANFIERFVAQLDKESPQISTVFIVTHAATKIALGRAILNDPEAEIRTGVCSLDTYDRADDGSWRATALGETHYLKDGEEMHWDFRKFNSHMLRSNKANHLLTVSTDNNYAPGSTEDMKSRHKL